MTRMSSSNRSKPSSINAAKTSRETENANSLAGDSINTLVPIRQSARLTAVEDALATPRRPGNQQCQLALKTPVFSGSRCGVCLGLAKSPFALDPRLHSSLFDQKFREASGQTDPCDRIQNQLAFGVAVEFGLPRLLGAASDLEAGSRIDK